MEKIDALLNRYIEILNLFVEEDSFLELNDIKSKSFGDLTYENILMLNKMSSNIENKNFGLRVKELLDETDFVIDSKEAANLIKINPFFLKRSLIKDSKTTIDVLKQCDSSIVEQAKPFVDILFEKKKETMEEYLNVNFDFSLAKLSDIYLIEYVRKNDYYETTKLMRESLSDKKERQRILNTVREKGYFFGIDRISKFEELDIEEVLKILSSESYKSDKFMSRRFTVNNIVDFTKIIPENFTLDDETYYFIKLINNEKLNEYMKKRFTDPKLNLYLEVMEALEHVYINPSSLLNILKREDTSSLLYTSTTLKKEILGAIYSHSDILGKIEYEKIVELSKGNNPFYIPNNVLNRDDVINCCVEKQLSEIQIKTLKDILNNVKYSKEQEINFLSVLDNEYKSTEDYVKKILASKSKLIDLTLIQKAAITLYLKKQMSFQGINDVNVVFKPKYNGTQFGFYSINEKQINAFVSSMTLKSDVGTWLSVFLHEKNHAIQFHNIEHGEFEKDLDVLVYSKDEFLSRIDGGYYERNYLNVSYEFDAQYKAEIEDKILRGETLDSIYKRASENIKRAQKGKVNIEFSAGGQYNYEYVRIDEFGEKVGLETLFDKKIKEAFDKYEGLKELIQNEYPLLAVGYDLDKKGKKRTLKEMLELINSTSDEKVKKACWYIIKERFDTVRFLKEEQELMYVDYKEILTFKFDSEEDKENAVNIAKAIKKRKELNSMKKFEVKKL